ncbi:MAG: peptidoglycan DD-metalloendopeptidase family protein [Candidatus Baltobacteraceae bacterium]
MFSDTSRTFRALVGCALVLVLAAGVATPARPNALEAVRAHQRRLDAIRARLHEKQAELQRAAAAAVDLHAQLAETRSAIGSADRELDVLDARVAASRRKLAWEQLQLAAAEASARRHEEAYRHRIVQIYEHGELSYLEFLLQSRTFSEFAERFEDLRLLVAADQRTVVERQRARRVLARREAAVEQTTVSLESDLAAEEQTRTRLDALAAERANLASLADRQRASVAQDVQSLDDLSDSEERALEAAIAQRQRELEAQRTAAGGSPAAPAHGSGQFIWPVHGPITSPFGYRTNPFGGAPDFHPGLDIAAETGTPILAADSGRVIIAGWVSGYGNYIAIDHGRGISTGYGHCSRIDVSVGQDVQRGQVIGAVGSTGHSTGPHVHFEIRVNGRPVDPAPRLP